MDNFKLSLTPVEYETLMELMVVVVAPSPEYKHIKDKIVLCLMQSLYARFHKKSLWRRSMVQFTLPIAEALAFQAFWVGKPMRQCISSAVINRIIAAIDQKVTSKISYT